jgi:cytidine deaminase
MKLQQIGFEFEEYNSAEELNASDILLLDKAKQATANAYAPYSNFKVASAARLINGEVITATNQENASYPAGICSERNLLAVASSLYPFVAIETIAITYKNENGESDHPISPCGICRQSLLEYEERMKHPIRLILSGMAGKIFIINAAKSLLPLSFTSSDLK